MDVDMDASPPGQPVPPRSTAYPVSYLSDSQDEEQMDRRMSEQSMHVLYSMQMDGLLCDATLLTTDGGRFPVHRNIMSVCSPYFRALFTNNMPAHLPIVRPDVRPTLVTTVNGGKPSTPYTKRSRHNDPPEGPDRKTSRTDLFRSSAHTSLHAVPPRPAILPLCTGPPVLEDADMVGGVENAITIPGLSGENLRIIIQFAYTRDAAITLENATDLMVDASQFNILKLMAKCRKFVLANVDILNCFSVLQFARNFQFVDTEKRVRRYVARNFQSIAESSTELMALSANDMAELLGADDLNAREEQLVWETALRWVEADSQNRQKHIHLLMTMTRLGLLGTRYFKERVKTHPYVVACVAENKACAQLVRQALKFLLELDTVFDGIVELEVTTPKMGLPRLPHDILFAVGGWSGGSPTNYIEAYDIRADRWSSVEEVDQAGPRAYHGVAVIGFAIYVIGGFDGVDYFNSCRCFNVVTKQWTEVAPMHCNRCYVSVALHNDIIYAMGGYDGRMRQSTAEKFNYRKNQWDKIASMNVRRSDSNATALDGRIYMVGGFDGQECMRSAEVYDPDINQWSLIANMHSQRSGVSCIAYHGYVYAVGGFNGTSRLRSAERYDPLNNVWAPFADMFNCRSNFAIEVIDDSMYAVGGFNGTTTIFSVECYHDQSNRWREVMDMSLFRSALSACVISDLPNMEDYIRKSREEMVEDRRQHFLVQRRGRQQHVNPIDV